MNLDFSSFFNPGSAPLAGKFMGLSGFEPGLKLDDLVTEKPNPNQMVLDTRGSISSDSKLDDIVGEYLRRSFDPNYQKETLKNKLDYDKEQMKQAFPYLMAREIPRQISEGFSNQATLNVLGARSAVEAMNETMRSRIPLSFTSVPYQAQKYFSQNKQMTSWSGGSSFSDLPSWQSSFDTKLPSSLNTGTQAGGGFGSMLGPALGLASAGIGLISGIGQQRTAASIAQAQLAAQNAAFLEGRERDKGALAGSLFNQIFGTGTGADISFGREKEAEKYKRQFLAPFDLALRSESAKRERLAAISPESKERARFENRLAIDREIAARRAQTDAMFGPISSSYRA